MKNSLRIHKWTHNEFNIFILGVLTRPLSQKKQKFPLSLIHVVFFILLQLLISVLVIFIYFSRPLNVLIPTWNMLGFTILY